MRVWTSPGLLDTLQFKITTKGGVYGKPQVQRGIEGRSGLSDNREGVQCSGLMKDGCSGPYGKERQKPL